MRPETQTDRQQSNLWTLQSVLRIIPGHKYHPIQAARTHTHALTHYKVTAHTYKHTVLFPSLLGGGITQTSIYFLQIYPHLT